MSGPRRESDPLRALKVESRLVTFRLPHFAQATASAPGVMTSFSKGCPQASHVYSKIGMHLS